VTDARNHTTTFTNDDLGRVTSVTNPLEETTVYTYAGTTLNVVPGSWTPGANLAEVEVGRTVADGEGQVRRRWDAEGRLRAIERKDDAGAFGVFASYAYDSDDNRTREIDALTRTTAFTFDLLGQLTAITDAAASPNVTESRRVLGGDPARAIGGCGDQATHRARGGDCSRWSMFLRLLALQVATADRREHLCRLAGCNHRRRNPRCLDSGFLAAFCG
jgi:YD repeat-containing protein